MKRGYYSKRSLQEAGWTPVAVIGRDIPTQPELKAAAKAAGLKEHSAWRMSDGEWHLCKRYEKNKSAAACHPAVCAAGLAEAPNRRAKARH